MKLRTSALWILFLLIAVRPAGAEVQSGESTVKAEDISDRAYYAKVRQLIGMASKTLDLSLSEMALGTDDDDPAGILIHDLLLAQKRGVQVRIFLNTYSGPGYDSSLFFREDMLYSLRREGVQVHFIDPSYRSKDRLLIADDQRVLEGGLPWTKEDLNRGLASSTLTDSRDLAVKKKMRLELLPLWDVEQLKIERSEGRIAIPVYLFRELKYFPTMAGNDDGDSMKVFLALLRTFYQTHSAEIEAVLEELGKEIPADKIYDKSALSFQVVKTLERLEQEYGLIKINEREADRMKITLLLPADTQSLVGAPPAFFNENYAKECSPAAIFAYFVILYRSQTSGESPVWLGAEGNVEKDFPLPGEVFRSGVKELRRKNLIELFPFRLNQTGDERRLRALEYRYLINPVVSLSEKLKTWSLLRDEFGDDKFKRSRDLAEMLDEPEDPKAIAGFLNLLKTYPYEDVLSVTQHVIALPEDSTPSRLDYIRILLEHEANSSSNLLTS